MKYSSKLILDLLKTDAIKHQSDTPKERYIREIFCFSRKYLRELEKCKECKEPCNHYKSVLEIYNSNQK